MEETLRALPDAAVQETSFECDAPSSQHEDDAVQQPRRGKTGPVAPSRHGEDDNTPDLRPSQLTGPTPSTARALGPDLLRGLLMVLMALDHGSILTARSHSTVLDGGERDTGVPVHRWNAVDGYVIRLLAHLCAPGFMLLLGMGIVYFGRSRRALGWSAGRMAWHFIVRAVLLTVVTALLGLVLTFGRLWFMNIVLFALAFDYLLAGMLWLIMARTEELLAFWLLRAMPDAEEDDAREPLLADRRGEEDIAPDRKIMRAADVSWHLHNAVLALLAVVTIWWNVWLSPTGGHCGPEKAAAAVLSGPASTLQQSNWSLLWFREIFGEHFISLYPPLAWLSFALVGLLYGRIVTARTWTRTALTLGHAVAGLAFLVMFVLTRVLHLGNLSEGCLQMPEHMARPGRNQYLASARSFFYLVAYPPEVAFWAFGIGCNLLLLGLLGLLPVAVACTVLQPLVAYGTSALFFYITHLLLLGLSWLLWRSAWGLPTGHDPWTRPDARGVGSEWVFWLNWVLVLVIMYPLCRWYGAYKRTKGPDSTWRFF